MFNNPSRNITTYVGPDPKVQELSTLMSRSWISFAHDLDPNNHGGMYALALSKLQNFCQTNVLLATLYSQGCTRMAGIQGVCI